jgi:NaMN:DMB phosphoribosyltransferase
VLLVGGHGALVARRPGLRTVSLPVDTAPDAPPARTIDAAVAWGRGAADEATDRGAELIVVALDAPEPARALAADLLGLDAVEAAGWPLERGLRDDAWMDDVAVLRDRLRQLRGLRDEPTATLRALGSPATAAAVALVLAATARRTPVLLDGPGAAAAALLARRVSYPAVDWWQAAHAGEDPVHERALGALGLRPLTRLEVTVEDGTAALAGLAILDQAAGLLDG